MKSAQEILEKHFPNPGGEDEQAIIRAMWEYARQACEEQKQICLKSAKADWDRHARGAIYAFVKDYTITNAPLPEVK